MLRAALASRGKLILPWLRRRPVLATPAGDFTEPAVERPVRCAISLAQPICAPCCPLAAQHARVTGASTRAVPIDAAALISMEEDELKLPKAANDNIDPNAPLRLAVAAEQAFPFGGMTPSGLRKERGRGRLTTWMIAGKEYTTLNAIEEMLEKCRLPNNLPVSGFDRQEEFHLLAGAGAADRDQR
jgi:hypothetical protein